MHRPAPTPIVDVPIERYALIGDAGTAALVSDEGSIDWLCLPDFDGDPVFARLLDPHGGHCSLRPRGLRSAKRTYVRGTPVLETTVTTDTGAATIHDFFAAAPGARKDAAFRPFRWLCRRIVGTAGTVSIDVELAPRDPFGGGRWSLSAAGRVAMGRRGGRALFASGSAPFAVEGDAVTSRLDVGVGQRAHLSLAYAERDIGVLPPNDMAVEWALDETIACWRDWSDRLRCAERYRRVVERSVLTLKLLTFAPSGAVVAAPTTSLPESIGGDRNWDYRYSWVRDASRSVVELQQHGHGEDAKAYLFWLANAARLTLPLVDTLYDLVGERGVSEEAIEGLRGYLGSAPVRKGNDAAGQFQLDNWAYLPDAAVAFADGAGDLPADVWPTVVRHADFAAENWTRPDHGIWEFRDRTRHFVHSKVMCWVAIDRALRLSRVIGEEAPRERWADAQSRIRRAVLSDGVDAETGSFVRAFNDRVIDASLLELSTVGFVDGDDPTMLATIDRVRSELGDGDLVMRYRSEDGLRGEEGAFLPCSFWLAHALALAGRRDEAIGVFEGACGRMNDVGLLPEEIEPRTGRFLGNFPQGLTHLGLLAAARAIGDQPNGR
ncbi:MAG TPA: glycoside hydrolase family 15 protein [Actinomycetota bacterium]|nr:glycoside hydrolase family 15 protein [Actinomycetota bacterium]